MGIEGAGAMTEDPMQSKPSGQGKLQKGHFGAKDHVGSAPLMLQHLGLWLKIL